MFGNNVNALIARGAGADTPQFNYLDSRTRAANALLTEQKLQDYPEDRMIQRELDEQALEIRRETLAIQKRALEQKEEGEITIDYPAFTLKGPKKAIAEASGLVAQFPDQVNDPGFMPWLAEYGISVTQKKPEKSPDVETWVTPGGQTMNLPKGQMPPAGSVPYKGKGMDIEFDPETGRPIRISQGGMRRDVAPMTKGTQGKIEEKIVSGAEQIARMEAIYKEFQPKYQELGTRFKNEWTGFKAKMGREVSSEDAKQLTEYKKFTRKAIENINLYIREMTGAQMSEKEVDRLRLAQPDPGEKWYQGDDPITLKAKMDDVLKMTKAAVARYEFYRAQGLDDKAIRQKINGGQAVTLESIASRM